MAWFNGWPWANFQEQNLDWIIKEVKRLHDLSIDYEEFKKQVDDFMKDLNVPQVVAEQIQELVNNGTIEQMIEDIGISALFDGAFLIPEQFKTNLNTWDDAFDDMIAAAASGSQVLIPAHTYDLDRAHYLPVNTVNNAGIYPGAEAYEPKKVKMLNYGHPKANKIESPVTAIQGACIHDGLLAIAEVKGSDIYLTIKDYATGTQASSTRLGTYAQIHGGSVAWDAANNRYVISTGVQDTVCICTTGGVVTVEIINIGLTDTHLAKIPGGYFIGDRTQGYRVTDEDFNVLFTVSIANMPARPNTNAYTELQDVEYHNGYIYYLWSAFDQIDNYASGFYIYRSDIVPDPTYELVAQRAYDDVIFTGFEAEHLIIDNNDIFHVGAYSGKYYFLMVYNNDNTLLENNDRNVKIYVDESRTVYGDGQSTNAFNCLFTGLYYAIHSNSSLVINNSEFPTGNYYGIKLVMEMHNTVFAGDWMMCDLEIDDSDIIAKTGLVHFRNRSRVMFNNVTYTVDPAYTRNILMQGTTGAEVVYYNFTCTMANAAHHIMYCLKTFIYTSGLTSNTSNMFNMIGGCLLTKIDSQAYNNTTSGSNKVL